MGSSTFLLGAFLKDKLMASILIFHDSQEWFYWHGMRDIDQDKYFAMDVRPFMPYGWLLKVKLDTLIWEGLMRLSR